MKSNTIKSIDRVYNQGNLISIIFRNNVRQKGTIFFTENKLPLQIGVHETSSKKIFSKHSHGYIKNKKIEKHEVLFVQNGSLSVKFFTTTGKIISTKRLKQGDGILIMNTLHQVTVSKNSKIIEIKQGPYEQS